NMSPCHGEDHRFESGRARRVCANNKEIMAGSTKDTEQLIEKMRELEWQVVCDFSPLWARTYLDKFRALSGPSVVVGFQILERTLASHVEVLRSQKSFPNFSELKEQALRELAEQEGVS
ncbi:MAG: hypothetical protein AAB612_01200, partial [Patescibacteria group bacterium]